MASPLLAHKPITSKYTYNEHVFPIFRDRCAVCHVDGGVAPMSLVTYADAYPWAESIRAELVAGHMPPWSAEDGPVRLRGRRSLTPRDLDIVLTWATGGAPEGPAAARPPAIALRNEWPLGPPDLTIDIPEPVTLAAGEMETTRVFVLKADHVRGRQIRAIDLLPGTPAIVRRATLVARDRSARPAPQGNPPAWDRAARRLDQSRTASVNGGRRGGSGPLGDTVLALWVPGGDVVAAPDGAAFTVPDEADLVATIVFRKTWKYENQAVTDRSRVGIYFATGGRAIEAVPLGATTPIENDADVLAVRLDGGVAGEPLALVATRPDGSRIPLLTATAAPEWPRRFWLEKPVRLPRGTQIHVTGRGAHLPAAVLDVTLR